MSSISTLVINALKRCFGMKTGTNVNIISETTK